MKFQKDWPLKRGATKRTLHEAGTNVSRKECSRPSPAEFTRIAPSPPSYDFPSRGSRQTPAAGCPDDPARPDIGFAGRGAVVRSRHRSTEGRHCVRRRDLLKAAAAAATLAGLAPRMVRAQGAKTLRFVGVADLSVLDPVVTGARPTRNAAYLVFDTLYGLDTEWKAQPQMVAGHSVENDGLMWNLTLRDGLRFHNGEPVLAKDIIASIRPF